MKNVFKSFRPPAGPHGRRRRLSLMLAIVTALLAAASVAGILYWVQNANRFRL